jgi:hypothetical protein
MKFTLDEQKRVNRELRVQSMLLISGSTELAMWVDESGLIVTNLEDERAANLLVTYNILMTPGVRRGETVGITREETRNFQDFISSSRFTTMPVQQLITEVKAWLAEFWLTPHPKTAESVVWAGARR